MAWSLFGEVGDVPEVSRRGVFLSYRRDDAGPYARSLHLQLSQRIPDAPIFMDLDSIEPGLDFAEVIGQAVSSSAVLVVLIGRQWAVLTDEDGVRRLDNPDDYVRFEVKTALEQGVRVIPVLVDGAKPLRQEELPAELHKLARLNAHKLSYDRYQNDADRLLDIIQRVLAAIGVMGHRRADSGPQTAEPAAGPPDDLAALTPPTAAYVMEAPLTLGATLNSPAHIESCPPAYPTGQAGAHFVFPLHNPNRVAFIVVALEVEVLSYQQIEIEQLIHGVGATDAIRRFKVEIEPQVRRYTATYDAHELLSEYVRVLPGDDDVFDLEVSTDAEGLFELCVHVKGTLNGELYDVSLPSRSIVFFDRHSNYQVQRSYDRVLSFDEYVAELSQSNNQLDVYLAAE
jgi:hypothetical protein